MESRHWVEVGVDPPGALLVERVAASARLVHDRHVAVIGNHRGCDPRWRSLVERRIDGTAADVWRALHELPEPFVSRGALTLAYSLPSREPSYDRVNHELRLRAVMHVPLSWPELPMWLAVARLSASRSALRLSLRSRWRIRYPARYYDAAHSLLTTLADRLSIPFSR